jgi:acyl carrier protein
MQDLNCAQNLVFRAIDELNAELPPSEQVKKSLATVLLGEGGSVDSMGFLSLAMYLQKAVLDAYDVPIAIADESLLAGASPFHTVETLVQHLARLLQHAHCT